MNNLGQRPETLDSGRYHVTVDKICFRVRNEPLQHCRKARIMQDRLEGLVVQAASLRLGSAGKLPTLRIGVMHDRG